MFGGRSADPIKIVSMIIKYMWLAHNKQTLSEQKCDKTKTMQNFDSIEMFSPNILLEGHPLPDEGDFLKELERSSKLQTNTF